MPQRKNQTEEARRETAYVVRRQMRTAENVECLNRLPGFELDRTLPTRFLEQLGRLHRAEDSARRQRRGRSDR